jgi:hypothetical protein
MREFIVTFVLSNGREIATMYRGATVEMVKSAIKREFAKDSLLLDVDDDLVIVKSNILYFTIREYEGDGNYS